MRICNWCGSENAPDNGPCPACGTDRPITHTGETIELLSQPEETDLYAQPTRKGAQPGSMFDGRFKIVRMVGEGGMGRVYEAVDFYDKERLALKVLLKKLMDAPGATTRFQREIEIVSRIRNSAVPKIKAWGTYRGEHYYASDFIDGTSLARQVKREGAWEPMAACRLVARVADALNAAHELGIVHRDVKPHNIMLGESGSVHLVDFGVARGPIGDMKTITTTGAIVGTPEYMAPEQLDSHRVDHRCDIYSLGVVLFELLTGSRPFGGTTPFEIAVKHQREPPPKPRSLRPQVPLWLDQVVLRCLEKNPENRFGTAAELRDILQEVRTTGGTKRRELPSGDLVIENDGQVSEWPLVFFTKVEKHGWEPGIALRFEGDFFELDQTHRPSGKKRMWTYKFINWEDGNILRHVVDYQSDLKFQRREGRRLRNKIKRWFG